MKRCAGCGFDWSMKSDECLNCGRPAHVARIEWKAEYGEPQTQL